MRPVDVILKKRDRGELTNAEIEYFVRGFASGEIPDYQVAAWAMAVLLNGMTERETTDLTLAMAHSGDVLDLTGTVPIAVDKHSTGGVGDKTSLVVAPVVASCGLAVGKMSGRGLGFSGGTLDKLEAIPGYRTNLSQTEFMEQLGRIGIVLTGQSADLAPADGKLYALRDVTGTVQSIPLIASSVMSKKIAAGAQAIVLDVKTGVGAFMTNLEQARELARLMVSIGTLTGRKVTALISDMNQPLGCAVGNGLETIESIEVLQGGGPDDFREHCLLVASHMLLLGKKVDSLEAGRAVAEQSIRSGAALAKFRELVEAQGGDVNYVDHPDRFPKASLIETVAAPQSGYLQQINAREIGETSIDLGGGRIRKGDTIDHAVGMMVLHKVGDWVEAGQPLFIIHANDHEKLNAARERLLNAHRWSPDPVQPLPLFYDVINN
jgi:pyrimidine-nucleoside phosphorylase